MIIKKYLCTVKEIISGFDLEISDGSFINFFRVNLYGRDLFIRNEDINDDNVVSFDEVCLYLDKFDYNNFCLKNELDILHKMKCCKTFRKYLKK